MIFHGKESPVREILYFMVLFPKRRKEPFAWAARPSSKG